MSDNFTNWVAFLDSLEVEIAQAHEDLDNERIFNEALLEEWSPPKHLEALPLELLERAQTINRSLNDLQLRTEGRKLELGHKIKQLGAAKKARGGTKSEYDGTVIPRYIDRHA